MIYHFLLTVEEKDDPKAIKGEDKICDLVSRRLFNLEESNYIKRFELQSIGVLGEKMRNSNAKGSDPKSGDQEEKEKRSERKTDERL